jgi:ubiquinone/menaquinone biosynthesis C-methylase UbiE
VVREGGLRGRRVLDVGCGTGRFAAALAGDAQVWAIDASPEMLAVAQARVPRTVRLKLARAEEPPFKAGWFDRLVYWLVIHVLDRPAAFASAHRLLAPDGRACIATFDGTYFDDFWLNRYFPRFEQIDRDRFPTAGELERELLGAGFRNVRLLRHRQQDRITREDAIAKIEGRHISTFDLLTPEEYERGRQLARAELPGEIDVEARWLIAIADR